MCTNHTSRFFVAVFAVALLLVAEAGVSPVSTTINGCVIKAKTKCVEADLKKAKLKDANLKGANFKKVDLLGVNLRGAALTGFTWSNRGCPDGTVTNTGC